MIKSKKGKVTIKGSVTEVMADLSCAIRALKLNLEATGKLNPREIVDKLVESAFMTDEEIEAEIAKQEKEELRKILNEVTENIKKDLEEEEKDHE